MVCLKKMHGTIHQSLPEQGIVHLQDDTGNDIYISMHGKRQREA